MIYADRSEAGATEAAGGDPHRRAVGWILVAGTPRRGVHRGALAHDDGAFAIRAEFRVDGGMATLSPPPLCATMSSLNWWLIG